MSRPVPNPGILDIAPYTPGKSPVPEPGRKVFKLSANETPFGPSPEGDGGLQAAPPRISRTIRKARRGCCAKRSAAPTGSTPTASSAAPVRTKSSTCSAHTYLEPGRRGDLHRPRLSGVPDRHHGERRQERRRARDRTSPPTSTRSSRAVTPTHKAGVACQPEQPDRDLRAVRRGQAAARRPAAACAAGAGRRLFRLRVAQRLRARPRAGGDHREHRDDAHLLQDSRAGRAARSAGCSARPISSTPSTGFAVRSTSRRRRCWRRWPRSRTPRTSQMSRAFTETVAQLADGRGRQSSD